MVLKASASSSISPPPLTSARASRSPSAICSAASRSRRIRRVTVDATSTAMSAAVSSVMSAAIVRPRTRVLTAASISLEG